MWLDSISAPLLSIFADRAVYISSTSVPKALPADDDGPRLSAVEKPALLSVIDIAQHPTHYTCSFSTTCTWWWHNVSIEVLAILGSS